MYIYIYKPYHDIMHVYVFNSVWPPRRSLHPKLPLCQLPPDVAISKVAAPSGKSDPPWSTPGVPAAHMRQSVMYHYHQQGQHGPFMVQFLFISSMMCWSWKGWFMIFCHPFLKDIESNSNFWFQSWLTSISAQPKKGVISAPWGQAAKKKCRCTWHRGAAEMWCWGLRQKKWIGFIR